MGEWWFVTISKFGQYSYFFCMTLKVHALCLFSSCVLFDKRLTLSGFLVSLLDAVMPILPTRVWEDDTTWWYSESSIFAIFHGESKKSGRHHGHVCLTYLLAFEFRAWTLVIACIVSQATPNLAPQSTQSRLVFLACEASSGHAQSIFSAKQLYGSEAPLTKRIHESRP